MHYLFYAQESLLKGLKGLYTISYGPASNTANTITTLVDMREARVHTRTSFAKKLILEQSKKWPFPVKE